jgi:hypothetical protein
MRKEDEYPEPGDLVAENGMSSPDDSQSAVLNDLGSRLRSQFETWKDSRQRIEDEWLVDLRQFLGIYEPDILARLPPGRSRVYVGLTRTKVMAAYSRIVDLLFQPGEYFYSLNPTPIPTIPGLEAKLMIEAAKEMKMLTGLEPSQAQDLIRERTEEIKEYIKEEARERAEKMTEVIHDQTTEANLEMKLKETIMEMCIFGTGAIKAGTLRVERSGHWRHNGEQHVLIYEERVLPEIESVSVFDLYPDPFATSMEDSTGIYRRHVLTKSQLAELKDSPGFDDQAIDYILTNFRHGNHQELQHEKDRRSLSNVNEYSESNRYEVLEFWGDIVGADLRDAGVEIEDSDLNSIFSANVWLCSDRVLKAQINPIPGAEIPYKLAPYEKTPHQFWGVGVPRQMRDSQVTMNAATRIFIDNMAISSGPLVEINTDLIAAGEDPTQIYPWRIFLREGGDAAMPMVRFYQPESNANALAGVIELFRRFADETTSLPSYTHGSTSGGMNKTATGMSMLMGAASISLKSVIKNIDDFLLAPMVRALYDWNMAWNPDEDIKGDMRIIARGSTALIQKEVQSQRLLQFMSLVANPAMGQMVNFEALIKDIAKSLDIDAERILKEMPEQEMGEMNGAEVEQGSGEGVAGVGQPSSVDSLVQPAPPTPRPMPQGSGNNGQLPL